MCTSLDSAHARLGRPLPYHPGIAEYALPIVLTFVGFFALAAILLVPVYRFLTREETRSEDWTHEALARRRMREGPPGDGATGRPPDDADPSHSGS